MFSPRYCCSAAATNSTRKQLAVVRAAQAEGLIELRQAPFDKEAPWASIKEVHDPAYVDALRTGNRSAWPRARGSHGRRDAHVSAAVRSRGITLVVNLAGGYTGITERLHVMTIRVMAFPST